MVLFLLMKLKLIVVYEKRYIVFDDLLKVDFINIAQFKVIRSQILPFSY